MGVAERTQRGDERMRRHRIVARRRVAGGYGAGDVHSGPALRERGAHLGEARKERRDLVQACLLYTSDAADE